MDYKTMYELERAKVVQCTTAMLAVAERLRPHASLEVEALGNLLLWAVEILSEARADPVEQPQDWVADVLAFYIRVGQTVGTSLPSIDSDLVQFRKRLFDEEYEEYQTALRDGDLIEVADAIGDQIYILIGDAISFGIDLRPVWKVIHTSNMEKLKGPRRADGKTLKPAGWQPPDIAGALKKGAL